MNSKGTRLHPKESKHQARPWLSVEHYPCDWNQEARRGRNKDERSNPVDTLELHDPRAWLEV